MNSSESIGQIPLGTKTRFAPTPSGYLHAGNILNLILTFGLSQRVQGECLLRIDDIDESRARTEYVERVFEVLNHFGLEWTGPQNSREFWLRYSLAHKKETYRRFLKRVQTKYVCNCSRQDIKKRGVESGYDGHCRNLKLEFRPGTSSWRFDSSSYSLPSKLRNLWDGKLMRTSAVSDFVIWRKNDTAAYQLMSVVEDYQQEIGLMVRGLDLFESSLSQILLAESLGLGTWMDNINWFWHPLILDENGQKVSKSKGKNLEKDHLDKLLNFLQQSPLSSLAENWKHKILATLE